MGTPSFRTIESVAALKGSGIVRGMANMMSIPPWFVLTGNPVLDFWALGHGIPGGRVVDVVSPPTGGKTTLELIACAQAQAANGEAYFDDVEYTLSEEHARDMLVNVDDLYVSNSPHLTAFLENVERICAARTVASRTSPLIITLDSFTSIPTKAEFNAGITGKIKAAKAKAKAKADASGDAGDADDGAAPKTEKVEKEGMTDKPREMSRWLRTGTRKLAEAGVTIVMSHQERAQIGVMFGNPMGEPSGQAVKFHRSVALRMFSAGKKRKRGKHILGKSNKVFVIKNKLFPASEGRYAYIALTHGVGFDADTALLMFGKENGDIGVKERGAAALRSIMDGRGWSYADSPYASRLSYDLGLDAADDGDVEEVDDDGKE